MTRGAARDGSAFSLYAVRASKPATGAVTGGRRRTAAGGLSVELLQRQVSSPKLISAHTAKPVSNSPATTTISQATTVTWPRRPAAPAP